MRSIPVFLTIATLTAPLAAQRVCMDMNTSVAMPGNLVTRAPAWVVAKYAAPQSLTNVSAMDLLLVSNATGLQVAVGIFAVDPATGEPGAQLASGTMVVNQESRTYSAALTPQISFAAGVEFYIGAEIGPLAQGTARLNYDATSAGISGPIYAGTPGAFSFLANWGIAFRLYCGTHSSTTLQIGQGKVGHNSVAPSLVGVGFPITGNPVAFQIVDTAPGQLAWLVMGAPSMAPLAPFGTTYANPAIAAVNNTTSSLGVLSFDLVVPNNPALANGLPLAFQGWILDPSATAGVGHTDGLWVTIGN